MMLSGFTLTNAIGAGGLLLSLIAYCLIRINTGDQISVHKLYCNARICFIVGLLKMGIGIFEITYFSGSGTWWGWILILFSIFWIVRGNKFRSQAANISAGYQPFNNNNIDDNNNNTQNRISNAPQVVIVSDTNQSSSIYPGGMAAPNALQQPIMSQADQSIIKNAVPPSPFMGTQGSNSYIVPSIPMTITPRSGSNTPIIHTQNIETNDDKNNTEIIKKTPERKTSEGNVTI